MPITHNTSDYGDCVAGTSLTKNVVVGAGDNIAALIGISWVEEVSNPAFVSSVTLDGVAATFIHLSTGVAGTSEQYYIKGLTAGTKTLIVAWSNPAPPAPVITGVAGIEVMNGVDQTSPLGVLAVGTGFSTSASVLVATTDSTGFVVDTIIVQSNVATSATVDAGQTQRWISGIGTAPARILGQGSTESGAASGTTMSWTISATRNWALAATEFRPFVDTTPPVTDVNVITSYHYLEVNPDKLDRADRLPEEAAKVWTGRWRH